MFCVSTYIFFYFYLSMSFAHLSFDGEYKIENTLASGPWCRASKALEVSQVIRTRASFVLSVFCCNEVTLGGLLGGTGHWRGQAMIRNLEFSAPPTYSAESERGARNGVRK